MTETLFDFDSKDLYDYFALNKDQVAEGVYEYTILVTSTTYDAGRGTIKLDRKRMRELFNVLGEELGVFGENSTLRASGDSSQEAE